MPAEDRMPGSPPDWLHRARSDLNLARLSRPEGVLLEDLCFHAQQAAEKALKAVLVANSMAVPNIHSIRRLIDLLPAKLDIPGEVQFAASLTDYAVSSRYPGDFEPVDEDEHREAVRLAEAVVSWVADLIGEEEEY